MPFLARLGAGWVHNSSGVTEWEAYSSPKTGYFLLSSLFSPLPQRVQGSCLSSLFFFSSSAKRFHLPSSIFPLLPFDGGPGFRGSGQAQPGAFGRALGQTRHQRRGQYRRLDLPMGISSPSPALARTFRPR